MEGRTKLMSRRGSHRLWFWIVPWLLTLAAALSGCTQTGNVAHSTPAPSASSAALSAPPVSSAAGSTEPPAPSPTPVATRATLAAIGDILIHNTVYQEAAGPDGTYDFKPMFQLVKDRLHTADIVVANQETVIGGAELGLSSYPVFNSPHEIGDALLDAGVTLVTTANNHTMDMGEKGILSATSYWDRIGMPYTGAFRSAEDRDRIRTISKNGITFAFLAYTYGTNGLSIPKEKPYLVNLFDEGLIKRDIEKAGQSADVVVVSAHWGVENETMPNEAQLSLAQKLADWGADIVIGTHPHVLQPFAWLTRSDGQMSLVMYSLGNFLSAQDEMLQLIGGIGQVTVVKTAANGTSVIALEHPALAPVFMQYENFRHYRIIPFDLLEKLRMDQVKPYWEETRKRLLQGLPELEIK